MAENLADKHEEFDVIVFGAGPAGENVAGRCADHGLSTAIVERELVGGECSYWGCMPSKVLLRPGDVLAAAHRVPGAASAVTGIVDVDATLRSRDAIVSHLHDEGQLQWLDDKNVALRRGAARLAGHRRVRVDHLDGSITMLVARAAVVLATGTSAALPPIPGLADAQPWTNREATGVKDVPARLAVLGGGAIGVEMAQAFRRLGAHEVTIIEGAPRLIAREEPFAGKEVRAALEAQGITVIVDAKVAAVERTHLSGPVTVRYATTAETQTRSLVADELLVAAGRRPSTGDLGLETVGLQPGRFVPVDDRLRAQGDGLEWLYAVGDCNGRSLLTHMGKYQARIAADVIAGRSITARADNGIVPRVTFTDPQVAAVGVTEAQARDAGINVRAVSYPLGNVAGAVTQGQGVNGTAFLVINDDKRTIVGATFTGPAVQELLHSATIAIAAAVSLDDLWHAVPSFPTVSEVWLRLLETYGL
jgi:dihydrolipoamide dehydrogenase